MKQPASIGMNDPYNTVEAQQVCNCIDFIHAVGRLRPREKLECDIRPGGLTANQIWAQGAYSLKHRVEQWLRKHHYANRKGDANIHTASFIEAALLCGATVRKVESPCWIYFYTPKQSRGAAP